MAAATTVNRAASDALLQFTLARLRGLHTPPRRVLSVDSNTAQFDCELAAVLGACGARLDLVCAPAAFTKTVAASGSALDILHHIGDVQSFLSGEAPSSDDVATYDVVILPLWRLAVQWATTPERLQALFSSAYRVLAPGGTLLLAEADAAQGVFACREIIHAYVPRDTLSALRASAALAVADGASGSEAKRSGVATAPSAPAGCIFHDDGVAVTLDLAAVHSFLRQEIAVAGSTGSSCSADSLTPHADASSDAAVATLGADKEAAASSVAHSGSTDASVAPPRSGKDREPLLFVEPLDAVLDLTAPTAVYRSIVNSGGGSAGGVSRSSSGASSGSGGGGSGGGALGTPAQQAAACAILSDVFGVDARGLAAFSRPLAGDVLSAVEGLNLYNVREGATSGSGAIGGLPLAPRRVTVHVPLRLWHVRKPTGVSMQRGAATAAALTGQVAAEGTSLAGAGGSASADSSSAAAPAASTAGATAASVSVLESVTSVALSAVSAVTRGTLSSLSLSFLSASSSSTTTAAGASDGAAADGGTGGRGKWWLLGCDSAPVGGASGSAPGSAPRRGGPWSASASAFAAVGGAADDSDGGAAARAAYVHYLRRLPVADASTTASAAASPGPADQSKSKRQKQQHGADGAEGSSGAGAGASALGGSPGSAFAPGGGLLCPNARRFPLALPPLPLLLSTPGSLDISSDGRLAFPGPGVQRPQQPQQQQKQPSKSSSNSSALVAAGAGSSASGGSGSNTPSVTFDPCFPCGRDRGFLNIGLANWQAQRAAWTARPAGFTHPPYPADFADELDDLLDDLTDNEVRHVELPGPVRLPDMLDLLLECWSPVDDDSDSDPDW